MFRTSLLIMALSCGLAGAQVHPPSQADNPPSTQQPSPTPAAPVVAVKETPPARIAYVQHQGPYWTLGPVFDLVREAMLKMNEDGPMFVRYPADPRKLSAEGQSSDVGFFLDGAGDPSSGLTIDRRPGEMVAYLLAPGPHGTTSRFYTLLYDWARENGYMAKSGPIEIYWGGRDRGAVEIQLPLAKAEVSTVANGADHAPRPDVAPFPSPQTTAPQIEPVERRLQVSEPINREAEPTETIARNDELAESSKRDAAQVEPIKREPPSPQTALHTNDRGRGEGAATEGPEPTQREPEMRREAEEDRLPTLPLPEPAGRARDSLTTPQPPNEPASRDSFASSPAEEDLLLSLTAAAELNMRVLDGDFDAAAAAILPEGLRVDSETQVWVSQFAYRLLAIGRGMRQKFGPEADAVQRMAEALLGRWRTVLPPGLDPLKLASRRTSLSDPAHRELLRRADHLLGRLAVGSVEPGPAEEEVVEMLQDVRQMLRPRG